MLLKHMDLEVLWEQSRPRIEISARDLSLPFSLAIAGGRSVFKFMLKIFFLTQSLAFCIMKTAPFFIVA